MQHDDQQRPESSGQKHHASGLDRKSLTELLGPALLHLRPDSTDQSYKY